MKRGYDTLENTLLGEIGVIVNDEGVEEVCLTKECLESYLKKHLELQRDEVLCKEAIKQIKEYFAGERLAFDLPISIEGTAFRKRVWEALRKIPYGETRSYRDIAESIDNPKAVRAVGSANKANPIPLIIPCHRVIGSSGKLVGFMGCRTDLQALLLQHEQAVIKQREKE